MRRIVAREGGSDPLPLAILSQLLFPSRFGMGHEPKQCGHARTIPESVPDVNPRLLFCQVALSGGAGRFVFAKLEALRVLPGKPERRLTRFARKGECTKARSNPLKPVVQAGWKGATCQSAECTTPIFGHPGDRPTVSILKVPPFPSIFPSDCPCRSREKTIIIFASAELESIHEDNPSQRGALAAVLLGEDYDSELKNRAMFIVCVPDRADLEFRCSGRSNDTPRIATSDSGMECQSRPGGCRLFPLLRDRFGCLHKQD